MASASYNDEISADCYVVSRPAFEATEKVDTSDIVSASKRSALPTAAPQKLQWDFLRDRPSSSPPVASLDRIFSDLPIPSTKKECLLWLASIEAAGLIHLIPADYMETLQEVMDDDEIDNHDALQKIEGGSSLFHLK